MRAQSARAAIKLGVVVDYISVRGAAIIYKRKWFIYPRRRAGS
jgi:hypothetical protein